MTRRPPSSPLFPSPPLSRSRPSVRLTGRPPAAHPLPDRGLRDVRPGGRLGERLAVLDDASDNNSATVRGEDRKSTRLNSSHLVISYAVFCLKKKKIKTRLTAPPARARRSPPSASSIPIAPLH